MYRCFMKVQYTGWIRTALEDQKTLEQYAAVAPDTWIWRRFYEEFGSAVVARLEVESDGIVGVQRDTRNDVPNKEQYNH